MNLPSLLAAYGLHPVGEPQPLTPGTVSRVWRVDTHQGVFLLRTLPSPTHGDLEWTIVRHLLSQNFTQTPPILPTLRGHAAVEEDGVWYQLQRYLPGPRPDPAVPGVAAAVAETVLRLDAALADCPPIAAPDRFCLQDAWAQGRERWSVPHRPLSWADDQVAAACALPEQDFQVIHGDLGPWNMACTPQGLYVLDFGEARMGDPCFDLSSALAGLLNHASPDHRSQVLEDFLSACGPQLDRSRLLDQTTLWTWRGIAQWLLLDHPRREEMISHFLAAHGWLTQALSQKEVL